MSLLFNGAYANPDTPLWLSALDPAPGTNNIQVSTITTNATGGVILTSDEVPYPGTSGSSVVFNRITGQPPTELVQAPSKNVPTKVSETTYLASVTNGGTVYDDIALRGLQIYGNQVVAPAANTGCAGYLTQGPLPFSTELYTGVFYTNQINASIGNFSTINVSTGTMVIPDPLQVSTLNASTINANTGLIGDLRTTNLTTSTLSVSSLVVAANVFSTLGVSTLTATNANISSATILNANISTISTGTISAGIGNFSTLNAPGFSGGGGTVAASTINSSTITTGLLSTTTGVIKEVFASTMVFNASVSPKVDLGLGGIIGGLIGTATANTLGVALGAANLATGIGSLVMARQSGGINPSVFQTLNGTSQLQFSTLGTATQTTFVLTDSAAPGTTPGNPVYTSTIIPPSTVCMRTVSDPLNLANSTGAAGQGIQGFSEWQPVLPGSLQITGNTITSLLNGSQIDFEGPGGNLSFYGPTSNPGDNRVLFKTPVTFETAVLGLTIRSDDFNANFSMNSPLGNFSTLNVSTFNIGTVTSPSFNVSSIITSTISVSSRANISTLGVAGTTTTANLVVSGQTTANNVAVNGTMVISNLNVSALLTGNAISANSLAMTASSTATFPNTATISSLTVANINGSPYNPVGGTSPPGSVIMYAGIAAPAGWALCQGQLYDGTLPQYLALWQTIGLIYGGSGQSSFAVPDFSNKTAFGAAITTFPNASPNYVFTITATTFDNVANSTTPNGLPARQVLSVTSIQQELVVGMFLADFGVSITGISGGAGYRGNGPATFNLPGTLVLTLSAPLLVSLTSQIVNIQAAGKGFGLGSSSDNNLQEQQTLQLANHTHVSAQPGGGASQLSGGIRAGDPNTSGPNTSGPNANAYYTINNVGFSIPQKMSNIPSMTVINFIIKF